MSPRSRLFLAALGAALLGGASPPAHRIALRVQPGQDADEVRAAAAAAGITPVSVEPLFPGAPVGDLARAYLVRVDDAALVGTPWDAAYAIRDAGGFEAAEVDTPDALAPEVGRRAATGACLVDGDPAAGKPGWSLRAIRADAAWELAPPPQGHRYGEGARVCHPDTGWSDHADVDADRIDLSQAWNLVDGNADARDPFHARFGLYPGHGTATASVIASAGGVEKTGDTTGPGRVTGVAPRATLVPLRSVESVIQLLDSDVARAVYRSVGAGCDVVSMSLGGKGFFGLEDAIRYAVSRGLVVVAAAGNCVGLVVAPAAYPVTIAVAASNERDLPWSGSSRGRAVALSAPGENVWCARRSSPSGPRDVVGTANGTSFATAEVAGAAALWVAYHGGALDALRAQGRTQEVFRELVRRSARRVPDLSPDLYGAGILDVRALLEEPLPSGWDAAPPLGPEPAAPAEPESLVLLSRMLDLDTAEVRRALAVVLVGGEGTLDQRVERYGPELVDIALRDPEGFRLALERAQQPAPDDDPRPRIAAQSLLERHASRALAAALR